MKKTEQLKLLKIKQEKNDLICEFMGTSEIPYSASWDFLMDVWVKIGKIQSDKLLVDEMEVTRKKCVIKSYTIPYSTKTKLIALNMIGDTYPGMVPDLKTAVFESIVEFIVWYNSIEK